MTIQFDSIYERDMDLLFMRKLAEDKAFVRQFFLESEEMAAKGYSGEEFTVEKVAHSVMTEDGESDIEAILSICGKKIALLIEDKIDAKAQPEQAARYVIRGDKAVACGDYNEYYIFIIAPADYLKRNGEAKKYKNKISYEDVVKSSENEFEKAVISYALSNANIVKLRRSKVVTEFWDKLYDYVDENYPETFRMQGHKGLEKSGIPGQWITMTCAKPYTLEIKCDRGYVDLEIGDYSDKFKKFYEDNKKLIDEKKLYIRGASKSLAIRKYVHQIDFTQTFDSQKEVLKEAFDAAEELQNLISKIEIR